MSTDPEPQVAEPSAMSLYCDCMEDIKTRLAVVDAIVAGKSPLGSEGLDGEVVMLQFRKVLEQICFASLIAHKDAYSEVHADFATVWSAKRLVKKLSAVHPEFYPKPGIIEGPNASGVKNIADRPADHLTADELVFLYDQSSEVLHTWNPYRSDARVIDLKFSVAEWVLRIRNLLQVHWIRLVGSPDLWLIQLDAGDGVVHAMLAEQAKEVPLYSLSASWITEPS